MKLKKIKVSSSDMKKYYAQNQEYRTAHILHRLRAEASKKERQKGLYCI